MDTKNLETMGSIGACLSGLWDLTQSQSKHRNRDVYLAATCDSANRNLMFLKQSSGSGFLIIHRRSCSVLLIKPNFLAELV
jgi:hypothetical protein